MEEYIDYKKAFPIINNSNVFDTGMSLRDYFAAKVLSGKLSTEYIGYSSSEQIAEHCYELADAMLKQREL